MSALPFDGFNNFLEYNGDSYNVRASRNLLTGFNSEGILFSLDCERNYLKAYNQCPPLKSLVAKRAKAFNTGILDVINTTSGKPGSGEIAKNIRNVLKKPNPLQTGKQFLSQHNIYLDIFGYCPVLIIRPFGVLDQIGQIWNIPPWLFEISYTGNWLQQTNVNGIFNGYKLVWQSGNIPLIPENLKLIFDDGFGTDDDINLTIPDSRLRSQEYPISNIVAAYKARNTLITRKGATGILSNQAKDVAGHVPLKENEKENLQSEFARYGIVGQEWQVIITDANLSWQQIGSPTKDLMLFEEIEDDVNSLCDAFGWYPELLARTKGATFDNKEKAEKMMYTSTIIPEANSRIEQLSNAIVPQGNNLALDISYVHVPALQAERLQTAQARKELDTALEKEFKNNVITLNEWLIALEKGERKDEFGDMYYYQLLELGWKFGTSTNTQTNNENNNQQTEENTNLKKTFTFMA